MNFIKIKHKREKEIFLNVYVFLIFFIVMNSSASAQIKIPPKDGLSNAMLQGYPLDTESHALADEAIIESAIAKYGTTDPWACKAFYTLSTIHGYLNRPREAIADLDACLRLPETFSGLHLSAQQMRMVYFSQLKNYKKAVEALNALINTPGPADEREKLLPRAYLLKAQYQMDIAKNNKDKMSDVIKSYKQFILKSKMNKGHDWNEFRSFGLRALAESLYESGKIKDSIKTYNDFLKLYPKDSASALLAYERLSIIRGGENKISIADLKNIVSKYPTNPGSGQHVLYQLAFAYYLKDDLNDAIPILIKIMQFVPSPNDKEYFRNQTADAAILLMIIYQRLGEIDKRNAIAFEIQKRFPDLPESIDAKNMLSTFNLQNSKEAINQRKRAIELVTMVFAMLGMLAIRVFINRKARISETAKLRK